MQSFRNVSFDIDVVINRFAFAKMTSIIHNSKVMRKSDIRISK